MNIKELENIINNSEHENEYWDFKEEWYEKNKKDELLRDIISFANTVHHEDCYLIIGVSDDKKIIGVEKNENRKNKQQLQDFLRSKKFAQRTYPQTNVETLKIENHEVDVITIYNSDEVPFFLQEKYGKLGAGAIYCRTNDSNTPKNLTATDKETELLWKKRFHEDTDIMDRFMYLMKREINNWEYVENNEFIGFLYKKDPDFKIVLVDNGETNYTVETYSLKQIRLDLSFQSIQFRYRDVLIETILGIWLDGGRILVPVPEQYGIPKNNPELCVYFLVRKSLKYKLMNFINDRLNQTDKDELDRFISNIIVFNTKNDLRKLLDQLEKAGVSSFYVNKKEIEELRAEIDRCFPISNGNKITDFKIEKMIKDIKLLQYIKEKIKL